MADNIDYYEQGQTDCLGYYTSQAYTSFSENITAEAAMKIFWPCVEEQQVQIAMPLPKPRQKWLAGFKKKQIEIRAQRLINCKCCGQLLPVIEEKDSEE